MSPRISICIPAYNADKFLSETLESVRLQTYTNWELLIVDDGSVDSTQEIIETFQTSVGQSVLYIRHDENRGLTATRNTGIAAASSEWIAILDADDIWLSNHLETCMDTATAIGSDIIHCGAQLFDSDSGKDLGVRAPTMHDIQAMPLSLFIGDYIIQPSSVVLKKSLWEKVGGFNENFQHVEDREMWLRCLRVGARVSYTGQTTLRYRKHTSAMSTHSYKMAESLSRVYAQHQDWDCIPFSIRQHYLQDTLVAAAKLCWRDNSHQAVRHIRQALRVSINIKLLAMYCICAAKATTSKRKGN